MKHEPGTRVGAILSADDETVKFLGYGMPARIYVAGGKPVGACRRVPQVRQPEARPWESRPFIASRKSLLAASKSGASKRRKR